MKFIRFKPGSFALIVFIVSFALTSWEIANCQAESTNAPAVSASTRDVSQYPTDEALLPGKGPLQTWKDFPKIWAQRHRDWQKTTDADKGSVVFLGDSITQFWKSLAADFPNLHVANRGISGDTTRGVLYRLNEVNDLDPEAVILLIGTNDLGLGADPADVADNIRTILARLRKASPKMPIIVCRVMPRSDRNLHLEEKIKKLNSFLDEMIKSDPRILECDTWSIYADANGDCSRSEFPDLLHPNATGYAKWVAALNPLLAKLNLDKQTQ